MRHYLSGSSCRGFAFGSHTGICAVLALLALWAPTWVIAARQEPAPVPAAPVERPQEDALLAAAFQYLDLSRAQRGQLLWAARQIEGRRQMFADEERRLLPEVQRLAGGDPESAARLKQMLDRDRAQMEADVLAFAAPHLVRTLTRTQILLAWRLQQGRPPKAFPADPILLDPAAGFVGNGPGSVIFLGRAEGGVAAPLSEDAEQEAMLQARRALAEEQLARAEQARAADLSRAEQERAQAEYERALVLTQERLSAAQDLEVATQFVVSPLSNPHFPQRVVESDSVEELAAAIEPFARRLFTSPRLAAALARPGGRSPSATRAPTRPSGSPRLVRDYRLDRAFGDVRHRGPDLLPLGGIIQEGLYRFGAGQGLQLDDAGVTDHYAVEMIFGCTAMQSYQKLIDFKQRAVDEGLYLLNNRLTFYNLAEGGQAPPGTMHRLRLERDRSTRLVRAYIDLQYAFAFLDLDDDASFKEGRGFFFIDDQTTSGEQGPGVAASLQVWDRPEGR